jgi:hypothetical protein
MHHQSSLSFTSRDLVVHYWPTNERFGEYHKELHLLERILAIDCFLGNVWSFDISFCWIYRGTSAYQLPVNHNR